jgi:hypothetical protein
MSNILKNFGKTLEAANIRIHPETYLSMMGFAFFTSLIVCGIVSVVGFFVAGPLTFLMLLVPAMVVVVFMFYPNMAAINRASNLDTEVPFAAAYVSVLASGGISPFKAFEKLKDVDFLPQLSVAAKPCPFCRIEHGFAPMAVAVCEESLEAKIVAEIGNAHASLMLEEAAQAAGAEARLSGEGLQVF